MNNGDDWRIDARCAKAPDPEIWFADPAEQKDRAAILQAREDMCTARDVCRMCPVRLQCLEFALYRPFLQGIWGGLSAEERDTMRKIRARYDESLAVELFPEPDLSSYVASSTLRQPSDAITKALRARRMCRECKTEQEYYISRNLGCCRDCAIKAQTSQESKEPTRKL